jgi:hypothetical protein
MIGIKMNYLKFKKKWIYSVLMALMAAVGFHYYSSGTPQGSEVNVTFSQNKNIKTNEMQKEESGEPKNQSSFGEPSWSKSPGNVFTPSFRQMKDNEIDLTQSKPGKKYEELIKIQSKLNNLIQEKNKDPEEMAKILQEIERLNGSPVMNGLRLDVLRENLQTIAKITPIAKKLEEIEQNNMKGNEKQEVERNQLIKQYQELGKKIRTDLIDNSSKNKGGD